MSFKSRARPKYPMVACDLTDVRGAPGLASPRSLAGEFSRAGVRWEAVTSGPGLFLVTRSVSPGAFGAIEKQLSPQAERVVSTFRSSMGSQELRQQLLKGRPVVGARFRVVRSGGGQAVIGGPIGDLGRRKPGPVPKRSKAEVAEAVLSHLGLAGALAPGDIEQVAFPLEGAIIWAFRVRVTQPGVAGDIRAYVRAEDLTLLYAQDVSCAGGFGEARVYPVNPGRSNDTSIVLLASLTGARGALSSDVVTVRPARGDAVVQPLHDYRLKPNDDGFDQVAAFHHMGTASQFFAALLGPDLFTDKPFQPLEVVVGDRSVRSQAGVFFPGRASISLADQPRVATSGDVCVHEFTHAVVHRVARLDDEFASPEARGLNEGFADYAQATIFDDPRFGDWVRDQPEGARRCDSADLRLPKNPSDPADRYVVGAAWAALLWDLRTALGAGVADAIAFHALQFIVPGATYQHACEALHSADTSLFPARKGGRHRSIIDETFSERMA